MQRLLFQGFLDQAANNEKKVDVYDVDGEHLNQVISSKYHVQGMIIMDFIHVLEYLWSAGWELFEKT